MSVWRNIDEIYRLVQRYKYTDENGEVYPASWKPGEPTIVPKHDNNKTSAYWNDVHKFNWFIKYSLNLKILNIIISFLIKFLYLYYGKYKNFKKLY